MKGIHKKVSRVVRVAGGELSESFDFFEMPQRTVSEALDIFAFILRAVELRIAVSALVTDFEPQGVLRPRLLIQLFERILKRVV